MYRLLLLLMLSVVNLQPNAANDLNEALNDFSVKFLQGYQQISASENKHENLFYSPISLAIALSLLLTGANGPTQQEIVDLLGFDSLMKNRSLNAALKKLQYENFKNNQTDLIVQMANRIYLQADIQLQGGFRNTAKEVYDSDVLELDFANKNPDGIKNEINSWIEEQTNNKLKNVLKDLDPSTLMMLINVIYFKAKWSEKFKEGEVCRNTFTNSNGEKKKVEMLCRTEKYLYGRFDRYEILRLDYKGDAAMYVVLPHETVNLNDLLPELNARKLNDELLKLVSEPIFLRLPKFELRTDIDLKPILKQLGVNTVFTEKADLSKMTKKTVLMVTEALQSAYILVNEEGTEAAAATIVKLGFSAPTKFYANRPFLFIIRQNGVNIFAGALKQL